MRLYADRPWLARYPSWLPHDIEADHPTMLELFRATLARNSSDPAIKYFDESLTFEDLDLRSDALACFLQDNGFAAGDRLALYTQNNPAFVVGLLAAWKAGGAAVAVNPMNKAAELSYLLSDSGATALLCLDELWEGVAREVLDKQDTAVRTAVVCSALDDQTRDDARLFDGSIRHTVEGAVSLPEVVRDLAGRQPTATQLAPDDVAVLTYTSGTTGKPKGAMNTHGNMTFNSQTYREWMKLGQEDAVLGVAPLFHITGLVGHIGLAMLTGAPLILAHRFEPHVVMDAIREHRPAFTIGSITVFIALSAVEGTTQQDWSSFKCIFSGGAPIAPAVTDKFEAQTGIYIHNFYGLTETNSPSHGVPLGERAPVDPDSGALSVGVPVFNTVVRIVAEDGSEAPIGEIGEIVTSGPQVVPGYWNRPEATAENLPGGELRTGDVGFMDKDGWFYLVDRKKDMINASGYKVWPREVEDMLYQHPDVREAAVVGVPDAYRGETVKAYVSLVSGATVTPQELVDWAKDRMAAYKYPRSIDLIEELPKTPTGKILRRELRDRPAGTPSDAG